MTTRIKIGVLGCGEFAVHFVELFKNHPYVDKVVVADTDKEKAEAAGARFGIEYCYSIDELLKKDINAVAIFTPRHTHGPLVIKSLLAGKHVYSAVPMASEVTHCQEIVKLVNETGLIYMMGETCIYYPCSMFCKEKFESGEMGKFVYAESQYHHDISHFSAHHQSDYAALGVPPFFYPTHSISMALAAAGSYVTKVSALGYEDTEDDPYFKPDVNLWGNTISNAFSLMRLANGGVIRINECRRIGHKAPSSYISAFYGTKGSYQFSNAQHLFTKLTDDGVEVTDVSDYLNPAAMTENKSTPDFKTKVANHTWQGDSFAPIQDNDRLPAEYKEIGNGHMASHHFLIDDFCRAVYEGKQPKVNAWAAARYTIPGLVAFESVKQGGAVLDVPDCGNPPAEDKLPQILMKHPDLTNLPPMKLPEGFEVHTHREGDLEAWSRIIGNAISPGIKFDFVKNGEDYSPEHVFYISHNGYDIATATAVEKYKNMGYFRMVGVHTDARGLGAGRMVCEAALHSLKDRGFKEALLSTDDTRIPAINLYLSLGFKPFYTHPSHKARWEKIMAEIEKHNANKNK